MKKLLLAAVAALITAFSANAQVKIESPHPDLDVKITRCAYASGAVVIDMVVTNFGSDEEIRFHGTSSPSAAAAYDDDGNVYKYGGNTHISLGLISEGLGFSPTIILPQDIPLKFRVQLEHIQTNATKFILLKIPVESDGAMDLSFERPIVIRNLEWVK